MANNILLIPGHGAGDSGATGWGYTEAERVRALATSMRKQGATVTIWESGNKNCYTETKAGRGLYNIGAKQYDAVIELHLDSAVESAHGGHVIIDDQLKPDSLDYALRDCIVKRFPGRSNSLVNRSDLLNVNVAQRRNINYRLTELCFISNLGDIDNYNKNLDTFAKELLAACNVAITGGSTGGNTGGNITPTGLRVDGWWGTDTTLALQKRMGTTQDGIISDQYAGDFNAINPNKRLETKSWKVTTNSGWRSQCIANLQQYFNGYGYGLKVDGKCGMLTIKALQKHLNTKGYKLDVDGYCGEKTVRALQEVLNAGTF